MHGQVDPIVEQSLVDFFGEGALAAEGGQGALPAVAAGRHRHNLNGQVGVSVGEHAPDAFDLGEGHRGRAGADAHRTRGCHVAEGSSQVRTATTSPDAHPRRPGSVTAASYSLARFASINASTCVHAFAGLAASASRRFALAAAAAAAAAASRSRRRRAANSRLRVAVLILAHRPAQRR
jgi:hypothetical protein